MKIKISILVMVMKVIKYKFDELLNHLKNYIITFDEFNEKYNEFMDNIVKFEYFKSEKKKGSASSNQKKNDKICKRLKIYC